MSASLISSAVATGTEQGYELNITRTFDAPRELVWKAWTDPEMVKEWMGPRGFKATTYEIPTEVGAAMVDGDEGPGAGHSRAGDAAAGWCDEGDSAAGAAVLHVRMGGPLERWTAGESVQGERGDDSTGRAEEERR